jgi:hypothetical protein
MIPRPAFCELSGMDGAALSNLFSLTNIFDDLSPSKLKT